MRSPGLALPLKNASSPNSGEGGADFEEEVGVVAEAIERMGLTPEQWLVDGGFPAHEQIDAVHGL